MSKVVLAPDKFKGSLPAQDVARAIAGGLKQVQPNLHVVACPIADGGDGTIAAALASGFHHEVVTASGPTGERVQTGYARKGDLAVVELASVCGLAQLPHGELAALTSSTFGLGEVIRGALDAGCRRIILGLGGSASTDGGAGMVSALGVRLLDADGRELARGGGHLFQLAAIDLSDMDDRLHNAELVIASDVDNPLVGPHGAATVYGPQKGASASEVELLDSALTHWARQVSQHRSADLSQAPGAGTAGGTGFAAMSILGATFRPGIEVVLEITGFADKLSGARLLITGEGSLDQQTLHGKGPAGVAAAGMSQRIPVVAVAGRSTLSTQELAQAGFAGGYWLTDEEPDATRSMRNAFALLERVGTHIANDWL